MEENSRGNHGTLEKWYIGSPKSKGERFHLDIDMVRG